MHDSLHRYAKRNYAVSPGAVLFFWATTFVYAVSQKSSHSAGYYWLTFTFSWFMEWFFLQLCNVVVPVGFGLLKTLIHSNRLWCLTVCLDCGCTYVSCVYLIINGAECVLVVWVQFAMQHTLRSENKYMLTLASLPLESSGRIPLLIFVDLQSDLMLLLLGNNILVLRLLLHKVQSVQLRKQTIFKVKIAHFCVRLFSFEIHTSHLELHGLMTYKTWQVTRKCKLLLLSGVCRSDEKIG